MISIAFKADKLNVLLPVEQVGNSTGLSTGVRRNTGHTTPWLRCDGV